MANQPPQHYKLPDAQDVMRDVQAEQRFRGHTLPGRVGGAAVVHAQEQQRAQDRKTDKENYRQFVERTIQSEARQAVNELAIAGVKPDVTITRKRILRTDRTARWRDLPRRGTSIFRHEAEIVEDPSVGGWILTPPRDPRDHHYPGVSAPERKPYHGRTSQPRGIYVLGTDGVIYEGVLKGPVVRPSVKNRVRKIETTVAANGPLSPIVPEHSVQPGPGGTWEYTDRIVADYGHPDGLRGYIPKPGEDDTRIIHGLGIREAIAALRLRAQGSPAPPPTPPVGP